jgi:hypothetical protein
VVLFQILRTANGRTLRYTAATGSASTLMSEATATLTLRCIPCFTPTEQSTNGVLMHLRFLRLTLLLTDSLMFCNAVLDFMPAVRNIYVLSRLKIKLRSYIQTILLKLRMYDQYFCSLDQQNMKGHNKLAGLEMK